MSPENQSSYCLLPLVIRVREQQYSYSDLLAEVIPVVLRAFVAGRWNLELSLSLFVVEIGGDGVYLSHTDSARS